MSTNSTTRARTRNVPTHNDLRKFVAPRLYTKRIACKQKCRHIFSISCPLHLFPPCFNTPCSFSVTLSAHMPCDSLPILHEVRLWGVFSYTASSLPRCGSVDVFHSGELETSIQVCMPRALARAYEQQRADATSNTRSQTSVFLVTDVRLEPDGRILVVGPHSVPDNRYHIDAYDRSGRALLVQHSLPSISDSRSKPGSVVTSPHGSRWAWTWSLRRSRDPPSCKASAGDERHHTLFVASGSCRCVGSAGRV